MKTNLKNILFAFNTRSSLFFLVNNCLHKRNCRQWKSGWNLTKTVKSDEHWKLSKGFNAHKRCQKWWRFTDKRGTSCWALLDFLKTNAAFLFFPFSLFLSFFFLAQRISAGMWFASETNIPRSPQGPGAVESQNYRRNRKTDIVHLQKDKNNYKSILLLNILGLVLLVSGNWPFGFTQIFHLIVLSVQALADKIVRKPSDSIGCQRLVENLSLVTHSWKIRDRKTNDKTSVKYSTAVQLCHYQAKLTSKTLFFSQIH